MKKTLLLLLFAVFAMGYMVQAQTSCSLNIDLNDSGGDGWGSNSLLVIYDYGTANADTVDYFLITGKHASLQRENLDACQIKFIWNTQNQYANECSFKFAFSNGVSFYKNPNDLSSPYDTILDFDCSYATRPCNITVAVATENEGYGTASGGGTNIQAGDTIPLTATPNPGYLFTHWSLENEVISANQSYELFVDGNANYVAHFIRINGVYVGNGESVDNRLPAATHVKKHIMSQQIYTADEVTAGQISTLSLFNAGSSVNRTYDIYMKNTDKNSFTAANDWVSVTADDKVFSGQVAMQEGEWNTITLTNAFTLNNGSNLAVLIYDKTNAIADTLKGRIFSTTGNQALYYVRPLGAITPTNSSSYNGTLLTIKNQIIFGYNYTINASANNSNYGTVTGGGTFASGETCTLTATPNEGYDFKGWKENNVYVYDGIDYEFTVEGNRNLVAVFEKHVIVKHWTPNVGLADNMIVVCDVAIDEQIVVNPNLEIGAFTYGNNAQCRASSLLFTQNNINKYVLTVLCNNNDNITFRLYDHQLGQELDDVMVCQTLAVGKIDTTLNMTVDFYQYHEVIANVAPQNAGTVEGAGTYLYNSQVELIATPAEGYEFVNWTRNDTVVSTNDHLSFTVKDDVTYVANFNILISAIADPTAGGSVTGAGSYAYGANCELLATPNVGYEFVNWTIGGVVQTTDPTLNFTVVEPGTYVANFNPIQFEIDAYANPTEGGSITGAGTYMYGTTCTLEAVANPGFVFVNWTKDDVVVETDATLSFTVLGDATYYANFESKQIYHLNQGWNWWSTTIQDQAIQSVIDGIGEYGRQIKNRTDAATWLESFNAWIGSLLYEDVDNTSSYAIQVTNSCSFELIGDHINPLEYPITLDQNWTWIGYTSKYEQNIETALKTLNDLNEIIDFVPSNRDVLKTLSGGAIYYSEYNTWLYDGAGFVLTPGIGYKYQSNAESDSRVLIFTNNVGGKDGKGESKFYWTNNAHAYVDNMMVVATAQIMDNEQYDSNLEVGAFVNGECRGRAHLKYFEPLNRYYAVLTIAGATGDEIEFGIVNAQSNLISLDCSDKLMFENDAVIGSVDKPVELHFAEMQEFSRSQLEMFPNPVSRNETVTFNLPDDEMVKEVVVTNAVGAVVKHNASSLTMIGEGMPMSGVYMVKVICNSGNVYIGKLIVK